MLFQETQGLGEAVGRGAFQPRRWWGGRGGGDAAPRWEGTSDSVDRDREAVARSTPPAPCGGGQPAGSAVPTGAEPAEWTAWWRRSDREQEGRTGQQTWSCWVEDSCVWEPGNEVKARGNVGSGSCACVGGRNWSLFVGLWRVQEDGVRGAREGDLRVWHLEGEAQLEVVRGRGGGEMEIPETLQETHSLVEVL